MYVPYLTTSDGLARIPSFHHNIATERRKPDEVIQDNV
jgi:hypothetical protein